jgi:hypothetical protein
MDVLGAAVTAAAEALAAEPAPPPASEYDDAMVVDDGEPDGVKLEDEPEAEPLPPPLRDKPTAEELAALVKQRQLFHAQSETMLQLAKRHKEVTGARLRQRVQRHCVSVRCLRSRLARSRRGPAEHRAEGRERPPAGGAPRIYAAAPCAPHERATALKTLSRRSLLAGGRQARAPRALAARRSGADGAVRRAVRARLTQLRSLP